MVASRSADITDAPEGDEDAIPPSAVQWLATRALLVGRLHDRAGSHPAGRGGGAPGPSELRVGDLVTFHASAASQSTTHRMFELKPGPEVISMSGDWRDAGRARTQAGGDDPNSDDPNSDDPPYAERTINP
jgi:hypothetical protein